MTAWLLLPPGKYVFKVKASYDNINWINAKKDFSFYIIAPIYKRWWFKILLTTLVFVLFVYVYRRRHLQLKHKKEELETEQAVNYFASSMYQQQTVDEIAWDFAKNCIGRLGFEDCVVYVLDEKRNLLMQKAVHGAKNLHNLEIIQPLEIPVGKGIVGTVAQNKKAEIVNDTSKDERYIADDAVRLSEIAVPIISDNKVLGVIDSEHSKKGFFTQKHLSLLTTIASLCANKIIRAKTEVGKKQAEMMLAETKQKMTEAEMQALRAQSMGVLGQSTGLTGGIGVFGQSSLNSSTGIGVKGVSYNTVLYSGSVVGINMSTGTGVYGEASGSSGSGVY